MKGGLETNTRLREQLHSSSHKRHYVNQQAEVTRLRMSIANVPGRHVTYVRIFSGMYCDARPINETHCLNVRFFDDKFRSVSMVDKACLTQVVQCMHSNEMQSVRYG